MRSIWWIAISGEFASKSLATTESLASTIASAIGTYCCTISAAISTTKSCATESSTTDSCGILLTSRASDGSHHV